MPSTSDIEILYERTVNGGDWLDISRRALIAGATFDSASNANPGTCEIVLRDPDRDMASIASGHRLRLKVDGVQLWSGFAFVRGRGNFLPAGDGRTLTRARKWTIRGGDNNTLLDRRVFSYPADYLKHIPFITTDRYDGWIIKHGLATYTDIPDADPWLDITSQIDDVSVPASTADGHITSKHPWEYPQQGSKVREMFNDASVISSGVFYFGPDDAVHYHAFQQRECPWGFSDRPNHMPLLAPGDPGYTAGFQGCYTGFRELDDDEDGAQLGTDAFVWGGSAFAGSGQTVFHRATDTYLEAKHGKWQIAEPHFDEEHFKLQEGVTQRAHMIVYGRPTHPANPESDANALPGSVVGEGPRGMRFPNWSLSLVWHTTDVPLQGGVARHLYPGDIVPIQLWTFSEDDGETPMLRYLPLRSLRVSFPTGAADGKALVQFAGTFDLTNNDPQFLWKWLRTRGKTIKSVVPAVVGDGSTTSPLGGYGNFVPSPNPPDGTSSIFSVPFGYIGGTTQITKNGLEQRNGTDYGESDPDAGEITFSSVPRTTDKLFVRCRTLLG